MFTSSGIPLADLCVLAVCHQAMFSLCMVESEADEVTLQGVTSVGLKHALDFAYTGQVSINNNHHSSTVTREKCCLRKVRIPRGGKKIKEDYVIELHTLCN